jgi:hypothetical protein
VIGDVGWWNGHMVIYAGKDYKGQDMVYTARNRKSRYGYNPLRWYEKKKKAQWYSYEVDDAIENNNYNNQKSDKCKKCRKTPFAFPIPGLEEIRI